MLMYLGLLTCMCSWVSFSSHFNKVTNQLQYLPGIILNLVIPTSFSFVVSPVTNVERHELRVSLETTEVMWVGHSWKELELARTIFV